MIPRLACIVPVLTLLMPTLPAQDAAKVGFPLAKKDSAVAFVARSKNEQSFDMGGQQMDAGHELTHEFRVAIVETKEDGGVLAEVTIQRIRGTFTMPMMGDVEFDTQQAADGKQVEEEAGGFGMPSASTMRQAMAELTGKPFKATVAANGKVTAIEGIDAVLKAAREKAGPMGGQMLAGGLSDGALKQLVGSTFGPLPKEPVAVGGTWEGDEDPRGGQEMPMQRQVKLTLDKADAATAEIKMSGTISSSPKKEGAAEAGGNDEAAEGRRMMQDAKIENGKVAGTVVVSRQDGFVVRAESLVTMDVLAQSPMGEMTIIVRSTTTLERQDGKGGQDKGAPKAEPVK